VVAHAQKPDFVFRRNGRVHLNQRGRQFSRLLAAEVCASAAVMLDTPCSEVVWRVLVTNSIRQFPLHLPSRASRAPSHFNWTLPTFLGLLHLDDDTDTLPRKVSDEIPTTKAVHHPRRAKTPLNVSIYMLITSSLGHMEWSRVRSLLITNIEYKNNKTVVPVRINITIIIMFMKG
jgi:hypothetical protein